MYGIHGSVTMTTRNFLILHFVRDDLHISGMRGNAFRACAVSLKSHASQRYIKAITLTIMYVADMVQPARMLFSYPLIDPITYYELCRELIDHDSTIRCMVSDVDATSFKQDLLVRERDESCKRKGSPEELGWRCPRRGVERTWHSEKGRSLKVHNSDILYDYGNYQPLRNQILGSHLEIQVILRLLHLWSTKTAVEKAQNEVKVSAWVGRVYLDSVVCLSYVELLQKN